jgi:hypothetical protein
MENINMDWVLIIITLLITLGSSAYIKSQYNKTRKIKNNKGITGHEVARKILDANGLSNVKVLEVNGELTDHYDPTNKTVSLSTDIYRNTSIASISVAAHECGHAIQDKNGYLFLRFRNSIVPLVNFASKVGYVAILIGLFTSLVKFLWVGIFLEFIILFFQLLTLPVEFNASDKALHQIYKLEIVNKKERGQCKGMLTAAALTYVAGVASAILQILRLLLMANRRR